MVLVSWGSSFFMRPRREAALSSPLLILSFAQVRVWDTDSFALLHVIENKAKDSVFVVLCFPDNRRAATGGVCKVIRIVDIHTGAFTLEVHGCRDFIRGMSHLITSRIDIDEEVHLVASSNDK